MDLIACPLCGFEFNPAGHAACSSCPLQPGCQLVCCPNCGYEVVDPRASKLANGAQRLLERLRLVKTGGYNRVGAGEEDGHSGT